MGALVAVPVEVFAALSLHLAAHLNASISTRIDPRIRLQNEQRLRIELQNTMTYAPQSIGNNSIVAVLGLIAFMSFLATLIQTPISSRDGDGTRDHDDDGTSILPFTIPSWTALQWFGYILLPLFLLFIICTLYYIIRLNLPSTDRIKRYVAQIYVKTGDTTGAVEPGTVITAPHHAVTIPTACNILMNVFPGTHVELRVNLPLGCRVLSATWHIRSPFTGWSTLACQTAWDNSDFDIQDNYVAFSVNYNGNGSSFAGSIYITYIE